MPEKIKDALKAQSMIIPSRPFRAHLPVLPDPGAMPPGYHAYGPSGLKNNTTAPSSNAKSPPPTNKPTTSSTNFTASQNKKSPSSKPMPEKIKDALKAQSMIIPSRPFRAHLPVLPDPGAMPPGYHASGPSGLKNNTTAPSSNAKSPPPTNKPTTSSTNSTASQNKKSPSSKALPAKRENALKAQSMIAWHNQPSTKKDNALKAQSMMAWHNQPSTKKDNALKAQSMIAWGSAPGTMPAPTQALKGRHNREAQCRNRS